VEAACPVGKGDFSLKGMAFCVFAQRPLVRLAFLFLALEAPLQIARVASPFMTTTRQSPSCVSQSTVCSPDHVAEESQNVSAPGGADGEVPARRE
jgi:hypothetical protein